MISVIVPTFNRPEGLRRAVESLYQQTLVETGFDLILVDNAPDASASEAIAALRQSCPPNVNLITLHEPAAGVANARNRAMTAVKTDLVVFLDDDQSAPETWLDALLDNYRAYPAEATFGPVLTKLPDGQRRHQQYFQDFFAREPDLDSGYTSNSFGCGNALIVFSRMPGGAPWFDTAMNEIGGEDDVLFARIRRAKGQFAWAAEAPVWEYPPAKRVALRYTLKRAFSYGQAPITLARKRAPARYDLVLFWMIVGAGKAALHGTHWLALSLIRHRRRAYALDKAVRGISKVFWWKDLRFYGNAALPKTGTKPEPAQAK